MVRALGLLVALLLVGSAAEAQSRPDFGDAEASARDAVASGDIPGVVVLVGKGDQILYHRAFGNRTLLPEPVPMAPDTIFDIASLTKPFGTTLAVMALVERGAIDLDAPLGQYLKEFKGRPFQGVTIRRMLTHSAGFPGYPPNATVERGFPRAAASLAAMKLDYPPGGSFQYSDTGFILLGEVVRRVSGQPLDRYLDRILFHPLELRDTSFHPTERSRVAATEIFNGRLLRGEVHDPRARLLGGVAGHAGMFSTASDLARICQMLLDNGALGRKRVFNPATVRLMWTRSPEGWGSRALGWDAMSSYTQGMALFFPAGSVGHTGFTGTSVWIDPSSRSYLIVLTNRVHPNGGGSARIRELRQRMTAAVGATLFSPSSVPPAATDATAADDAPANGNESPDGKNDADKSTDAKNADGSVSTSTGAPTGGPTAPDAAAPEVTPPATPPPARVVLRPIRSGLDVLVDRNFTMLAGHRVGLVTNQTGIDARGRRGIDLIANAAGVRLEAIFSPEHGLTGTSNTNVPHGRDPVTGRPVWSLYGSARRPTAEMLHNVDMIVFDVQDVGARYYTYLTTLVYVMEEAARHRIPVVVLDRPNPITGRVVEGPLMDPDLISFTAPHPIPVRTGMTIGEFARMAATERRIPVKLTVVPLAGWDRSRWFDDTGLPWVNPSPNIRSVAQALLYAGVGLLEATNLSVGRGTDMPFEVVGAPWIDSNVLADVLNRRHLAGVRFEPVWFTPTEDVYARVSCGGVRLVTTDRDAIRPVTVAFAVAGALRELYRDQFRPESIQNLLVNRSTMWAFLRSEPLDRVLAWADMERVSFLNRRASYLIYP
ncbi:MAG TPA: exo-beta-N-acetylmuramidase NamZ domain-containing protein [Methylomirabilota bacterium]